MAQFGDLLAELRQDRGLTQSELGKVISVTSGTISNYEHGFHLPDLEKLVLLADYFGVSTDYLLGRISSNLPIDVLQKALTDGTPVSDVIHSLFQLPPDRQRAILLVISDMAFRAMVDQYGTGEGKYVQCFLSQLLSSLLRTKMTEPLWKISTPLTTDSCTIQFISLPKTLGLLKIFFRAQQRN